jgi:hypothetical protein
MEIEHSLKRNWTAVHRQILTSSFLAMLLALASLVVVSLFAGCRSSKVVQWQLSDIDRREFALGFKLALSDTYKEVEKVPDLVMKLSHGFEPIKNNQIFETKRLYFMKGDSYRVVWIQKTEAGRFSISWVELTRDGCYLDEGLHFMVGLAL